VASLAIEKYVVSLLDIGEVIIPCAWMLQVVHMQNVYDHPVDDLYLAINLGVESHGLSEIGIQHQPES